MITVELKDVLLHAFHGIYEGEEKVGNPYLINLSVHYDERFADFDHIENTIDYTVLYDIIKQRMQIPTGLLEKVAESMILKIKHQYSFITEINLSIHKLEVPIKQFQGKLGITMNRKFNE
jgi:dihydroneopterin aldolase